MPPAAATSAHVSAAPRTFVWWCTATRIPARPSATAIARPTRAPAPVTRTLLPRSSTTATVYRGKVTFAGQLPGDGYFASFSTETTQSAAPSPVSSLDAMPALTAEPSGST